MKRWIYGLPLIVVVGFAWFFSQNFGARRVSETSSPLVGKPAPVVDVVALPGKKCGIRPDMFKGEITVVTFFASWCGPCSLNHEAYKSLAREPGVQLVGVNFQDNPLNAQMWLMQRDDPYTCIGSDPQGQASVAWGIKGVPQMYILDRKGIVRYAHLGTLSPHEIRNSVVPLIDALRREPA